jgi:hypothetical protein
MTNATRADFEKAAQKLGYSTIRHINCKYDWLEGKYKSSKTNILYQGFLIGT